MIYLSQSGISFLRHRRDKVMGSSTIDIAMREFKECVEEIEVMDVQRTGMKFTWNQKPRGVDGILKKIDRIMANLDFFDLFPGGHAIFQPYRLSDHSPAVLCLPTVVPMKPKPFKFTNILVQNKGFKDVVNEGWNKTVSGFHMYKVVVRLRHMKKAFRKLMYDGGNLHANVIRLRHELDTVQRDLDRDPCNATLREEAAVYLNTYNEAILLEEGFLKQKAKVEWLRDGDSNSAYFHKSVKSRMNRSRIDVISNSDGVIFQNENVANAFVSHYENFLGQADVVVPLCSDDLFSNQLDEADALVMIREVSDQEIKDALFSMGNDKAPGPDGYTAAFFKEAWSIISKDFILAIREFFVNGKLLKELNHTIIALLPKVNAPSRVNDFRPISCCNVLFKCISKIIANRIKDSLKVLVSSNQSAFVPGRNIADNILLTQELMHNYHLDRGPSRCAFKVDIQKAYDTVDWGFLKDILLGFGFHMRLIGWIMECVTTTSFSISINGALHGYFKGKRGLRQGDPLSPYLFTLVMEILTLMIRRRVLNSDSFKFHPYCFKLDLVNLCFADDLFLFSHGDVNSSKVIMEALDEFRDASGLTPSIPKSTAYFCNVLNHVKLSILQIFPFEEGKLPVKYLGVPLVSSRLMFRDCKELIEKVQARVDNWKNKFLSTAGRLQLIQSVIGSLHVFWASVFVLPSQVLLDIEQIMRGFLWCQGKLRNGQAKVAWEEICLPKIEGGLGIRRLACFNNALMVPHIWNLINRKESLWVQWIHSYKLANRNFWDIPIRGNMTCGWRKILRLRPLIRDFIRYKVGDGSSISVWHDCWCDYSPLTNIISNRSIYSAGLHQATTISGVVSAGQFTWPQEWYSTYPLLNSLTPPIIKPGVRDSVVWRDLDGVIKPFSVHSVWNSIRPRSDKVPWFHCVWFTGCIPRHALNFWLIVKRRLKTQDKLKAWDKVNPDKRVCSLCEGQEDSHEHLFFECSFSKQIWQQVKCYAGLSGSDFSIDNIIQDIIPFAMKRSSKSICAKLVVAAASFFIWQERNNRLFRSEKRSVDNVVACIFNTVRLKLVSFTWKKSRAVLDIMKLWKIESIRLQD
ncbi:hypothetical protein Tco_0751033 [Tanacetum coccineum]|uniref:Reverse transcriptase domain-containing protein n=1 Tax=Tanacetum coccineum TaxID=301880 RepID=A0ABQ4Z642_9ASTR